MTFKNLSKDAENVFNFIENEIEYQPMKYSIDFFIYAILFMKEENMANNALLSVMMEDDINTLKMAYENIISNNLSIKSKGKPIYDEIYNITISNLIKLENRKRKKINSAEILMEFMMDDEETKIRFGKFGVTSEQIKFFLDEDNNYIDDKDKSEKLIKHEKVSKKINKVTIKKEESEENSNTVERELINISKLADEGLIEEIMGNDEIIMNIFGILSKKSKNNVILIGDSGVGKTCTIKHIANMIRDKNVPKCFIEKKLMLFDLMTLTIGTTYRGSLETKINTIVDDAERSGKYIFIIDDIHQYLSGSGKIGDISIDIILDKILSSEKIATICISSTDGYSKYISNNDLLSRKLQKIELKEKSEDESFEIIKKIISSYENFHNVKFSDDAIRASIHYGKSFMRSRRLPDSAIDILDETGARLRLSILTNPKIKILENKLKLILDEINKITNTSTKKEYDKIDQLKKKEIDIKSEIGNIEKEEVLNSETIKVEENDVKKTISNKVGVPITKLTNDEISSLKNLEENMNKVIIGQEDAVNEVVKSVKRKRIGISNLDKPSVFLMVGKTGCGKTYLAKTLANQLFGNNNGFVTIDMSEYTEKMSVNKLYGSASGYVGYEEGGLLTEAIKKNSHCVLLLDEIEKANEEIFNVLLQIFDEGRLTDNKGFSVDFRNVIIIMTSNVGVKEVSENGASMGFIKGDTDERDKLTIMKSIKRTFKPEFINRIGHIIYFRTLNDNDLKKIIKLEISNVNERMKHINYSLDSTILDGKLIDSIFEAISESKEYGARPILREIQKQLEDKLTDYIIDKIPPKGTIFTYDNIYCKYNY